MSCMNFRIIQSVIKFLDDQQTTKFRRVRTTRFAIVCTVCNQIHINGKKAVCQTWSSAVTDYALEREAKNKRGSK